MMTKEEFKEIQPQLIETLAGALEAALLEMGEDAQGVDWFSSVADTYEPKSKRP